MMLAAPCSVPATPVAARGAPALHTRLMLSAGMSFRLPANRTSPKQWRSCAYPGQKPPVDIGKAFKRVQNGSDIRGVAIEGSRGEELTLTPATAYFIAKSFGHWLEKRGLKDIRVAVGTDPRITAPLLKPAVVAGLLDAGAMVTDVGLSTTPAMFYSIIAPGSTTCGSIMMTASHMPFQNNGLKFFVKEGGLAKKDITEVLEAAAEQCQQAGVALGEVISDHAFVLQRALEQRADVQTNDLLSEYSAHLREVIKSGINHPDHQDKPLSGLKIVVDAGNGSGGYFATQVLAPLGADTTGSQFLEPDGTFPNHIPNPENKAAMAAAVDMVKKSGADLGIIFDTDVDRSAIVDSAASSINSNRFIALMAAIALREHPGTTIVTDSVTSNGLATFIEGLGGKHLRYMRGYKNVIGKGMELNQAGTDCALMMETSGHGALAENHFLDDGAYLAVKAIVQLVRLRLEGKGDLGAILDTLPEPQEAQEIRMKINDEDFKAAGAQVLDAFHDWVAGGAGGQSHWALEEVNHEGWRVNVDEGDGKRGWLLLRQSLHDPLLVLNVESDRVGGAAAITRPLLEFLQQQANSKLDLSGFRV